MTFVLELFIHLHQLQSHIILIWIWDAQDKNYLHMFFERKVQLQTLLLFPHIINWRLSSPFQGTCDLPSRY